MSDDRQNIYDRVGPVLQSGELGNAIVEAIRDLNSDVLVTDRGAYLRVLVPERCVVTRDAIERHLGRPIRFPGELETVMSAFKGALRLSENQAIWQFGTAAGQR